MTTTKKSKSKERETRGATGEGEFYHIEVKPKEGFVKFRTQDVGKKGGLERVGGQRENGTWNTVKWLVSKEIAHVENGKLVADHPDVKGLLDELGSEPKHIEGDRFEAKDGPERSRERQARKDSGGVISSGKSNGQQTSGGESKTMNQ